MLVQNLPSSSFDHEDLPKLIHLLSDPSTSVQKISYGILREAAKRYTEHLIIEAGVDLEEQVKCELPGELVSFLQNSVDLHDPASETAAITFGTLISWMVLFDLFEDASVKVKSGYLEHLTKTGLVTTGLMPIIFTHLDIDTGAKPFKLDLWSVDEFLIDECDPSDELSVRLLTAHVYYRALVTVPSFAREYITSSGRRTQATAAAYTATYYSPIIIADELARVKSASATSELDVENLSVKVAPSVREVSAVYTVEEYTLELTLKIPADWPLTRFEVKDTRRTGVRENLWRGWMLGVQQVIWSQNGHVVDAIILFKKNVTLHFGGQAECPICYSIISVAEGSLPRKPCKTCNNRFHSSCLYKWFETSHSTSCPLCRSNIM